MESLSNTMSTKQLSNYSVLRHSTRILVIQNGPKQLNIESSGDDIEDANVTQAEA